MSLATLHAGFGRTVITPSLAVPHAGWGAQTHLLADGVHRDLFVSVLLLTRVEGDRRVASALVEFDLVGLYGLESEIQAAVANDCGVAPAEVRVSVTHNHANPVMWDNWIGGRPEAVAAYRGGLPAAAAGAARAALLSLRPVRMAASLGRCTIGRNRRQRVSDPGGSERVIVGRDDAGATDPDVLVVRFDDLDGAPFTAIMGYTCHPTTLGPDNRLHSPDYPGVAKAVFQAATGASCLFIQGAAGNVGPVHGFTGDIAVVERLGASLGLEAARVFTETDTRPVELRYVRPRESGATLAVWEEQPVPEAGTHLATLRRRVPLPLRPQPPLEEATAEYARMRDELARVMADGSPPEDVEATMFRARRAQMAVTRARTYGGRETIDVTLELLRCNEVAIVGCNGEPFCEIGLAIKEVSPFGITFFGGYTGASLGYVPWPSAYAEGGYEVETTPYTEEAAGRLVSAATEALEELARA
jgi:neutral ceramidase